MNLESICRLCLCVPAEIPCKLDCDVLNKIDSCLSIKITINENLPNQVCSDCRNKIQDVYLFRQMISKNEKYLHNCLSKGLIPNHINLDNDKYIIAICKESMDNNINENNDDFNDVKKERVANDDDSYSSDDNCTLSVIKTHVIKNETENVINLPQNRVQSNENCNLEVKLHSDLKFEDSAIEDIKNIKDEENTVKDIAEVFNENINDINDSTINVLMQENCKCLTCPNNFSTQIELFNHYKNEHGNTTNNESNKNNFTIINDDDKKMYKCNECDKMYDKRSNIKKHLITHVNDRPFICKECGRTYKTVSEIVRHGRAHSDGGLKCSFNCGYITVYKNALENHEKRHKTEFKYTCEKCGKGFQVKTWYEQHQNIHKGVKPFVCDLCGLAFHMNRYLTSHRSAVHPQSSSVKKYICVHCSLPCDHRKTLTDHLKSVHGVKKFFLCELCGKTLSSAEHLKFHECSHLGIRPYSCSVCKKSFVKKFNLQQHERTHTGERAHECAHCGKRYLQRSTLNRHSRVHHRESSKCAKCEIPVGSQTNLENHYKLCVSAANDNKICEN